MQTQTRPLARAPRPNETLEPQTPSPQAREQKLPRQVRRMVEHRARLHMNDGVQQDCSMAGRP